MNARDAAREYLARGFAPIPIPAGSKAPVLSGWPNLKVTHDDVEVHFDTDSNVGLLLGTPSAGLIDVDVDAPEAVQLAASVLPDTDMIHGRAGKRRSHFWYRPTSGLPTKRLLDVDGTCLVEIRGTGAQTVVPPSTHPCGEAIEWAESGEPAEVSATELTDGVSALAAAALLVRRYPKPGGRQDFALALSGTLLKGGWPEDEARAFIRNVAQAAGDEEAEKRAETVGPTAEKLAQGGKVTAFPTLSRLIGEEAARKLAEWLHLRRGPSSDPSGPSGASGARGCNKGPDRLQLLFELIPDVELFHSAEDEGFATVDSPTGPESFPIQSRAFTNWLCRRAFETFNHYPREQVLKEFTHQLAARALYECPSKDVYLRVAPGDGGHILIDLGDPARNVVEVTPAGWHVHQRCCTRFHRPIGMQPISMPVKCVDLGVFGQLFNYSSEDDLRLLLAWLVFAWNPRGPYPVLVLGGEAGSAKSTTARMLRGLVDPVSLPLRSFPRNEHEFMIAGRSSYILCFDNISGLTEQQSDMLCRAATGGGFGVRQLYSNSEEVLFSLCRPVIVNGIDDLAKRPDLIDRAVVLTLPAIPPEQRWGEAMLLQNFERARPYLVGALLNVLVETLRQLPSVGLTLSPRMADFARSSTAAEKAIGWPAGGFQEALYYNRQSALQTGVESSVVAAAVYALMAQRVEWHGTATDLLNELTAITASARNQRGWPKTASQLGDQMRRVAPALRAHGISVVFRKSPDARRTRLIHLSRAAGAAERSTGGTGPVNGDGGVQLGLGGFAPDTADGPDATSVDPKSLQ